MTRTDWNRIDKVEFEVYELNWRGWYTLVDTVWAKDIEEAFKLANKGNDGSSYQVQPA